MELILAEKPSAARNFAKALGGKTGNYAGTEYKIRDIAIGNTGTVTGSIESSAGNMLTLPKMHNIQSLYFDSKSRIYVSTEPAVCTTGTG